MSYRKKRVGLQKKFSEQSKSSESSRHHSLFYHVSTDYDGRIDGSIDEDARDESRPQEEMERIASERTRQYYS